MNAEQETLKEIQTIIDALPPMQSNRVLVIARLFRSITRDNEEARIAFALVGAELAAEE